MVDLLIDAWKQHLATLISDCWNSIAFWRSLGLILLTVVAVGIAFWKRLADWIFDQKSIEHDVALFKSADSVVNEAFLDDLLNGNLYHRWCRGKDASVLDHFCQEFSRVGNQYLHRNLKLVMGEFLQNLSSLNHFIAHNFFPVGSDDHLKLYPETIDRDRYDDYVKQLNTLTDTAWKSYLKYRATVKTKLKV